MCVCVCVCVCVCAVDFYKPLSMLVLHRRNFLAFFTTQRQTRIASNMYISIHVNCMYVCMRVCLYMCSIPLTVHRVP